MTLLGNLLRHDRAVVLTALAAVVALAWLYLLLGADIAMDEMDMGGGEIMLMTPPWTPGYALLIFLMWSIMMLAMMLPGAAPTILLVTALGRQRGDGGGRTAGLFSLGYVLVWIGFSAAATALQYWLDRVEMLSGEMAVGGGVLAGGLLIAAGIYQWLPLKRACLLHCRSPLAFLLHHWRTGGWAALTNGLRHGAFCLGCCWMLMALLFVGGLMNLLWIAALALLIFFEKALPWGGRMSRILGLVLIGWGAVAGATALWGALPVPG
jgi:predicted metal-binding membrane protein